jgi:hypothetical protein
MEAFPLNIDLRSRWGRIDHSVQIGPDLLAQASRHIDVERLVDVDRLAKPSADDRPRRVAAAFDRNGQVVRSLELGIVLETDFKTFGVTMYRIVFVSALALALTASGGAFAQPPTSMPNASSPSAANPPKAKQQAALTVENLKQDLQKAGFTEVKVLEDAFLIQAKTKDGTPIMLTIGPNGMGALEVSNVGGSSPAPTTGKNPPTNNPASVPAKSGQH